MPGTIPRLQFADGTLVLDAMAPSTVRKLFGNKFWVWDSRVSLWRCDAIEYLTVRRLLANESVTHTDAVPSWVRVNWPKVDLPNLRLEQHEALAAWNANRRSVLVMPTGTGKTEVALSIMKETAVSTLIVAPVRDLMYQWHRRILQGLGYDAGIVGDGVHRVEPVSATTYDSACIHMDRLGNRFALIVFDECHHLPGDVRRDAARMAAAPWRLGLTATLERSDGKHADLDRLIGPVAYELPMEAVRGETLADYEVVRVPVHLNEAEQAHYNTLSAQVRHYLVQRAQKDPKYSWPDLWLKSRARIQPRAAGMRAYFGKRRSRIEQPRSCAYSKTSSACTPAAQLSSSPGPTPWLETFLVAS